MGYPPRRIDILTSISGVEFVEAWESRIEARFGDVTCFAINIDDLIVNKRASGRTKDLADAEALEAIRNAQTTS